MSEISMYEAQKKKMQGLCDEHDLVYRFEKDRYPIIFTIKPVQGMDAQISMLENVEEVGYRSPDASMSWIFEDGGLDTKVTGGTFTISKTLRTKIESILVKMITYWQQYFFRDVLEKNALRSGLMPVIDEDEADDTDEEPEDEGDMQGEDGPEVCWKRTHCAAASCRSLTRTRLAIPTRSRRTRGICRARMAPRLTWTTPTFSRPLPLFGQRIKRLWGCCNAV